MCGGATLQSNEALFNAIAVKALHVLFERGGHLLRHSFGQRPPSPGTRSRTDS